MSVIQFPGKKDDADGPHWSGEAMCTACGHEWQAVVPVGTVDSLECPACHRIQGCSKHCIEPSDAIWVCNCGGELFWLLPQGAMCRRCGIVSSDWAN